MAGQKGEGEGHAAGAGGDYSVADMEPCPQDFYYSNFSKYYLGSLFYSFKFKFKVFCLKVGIGSYTFQQEHIKDSLFQPLSSYKCYL